jgi:hypothetical protein
VSKLLFNGLLRVYAAFDVRKEEQEEEKEKGRSEPQENTKSQPV